MASMARRLITSYNFCCQLPDISRHSLSSSGKRPGNPPRPKKIQDGMSCRLLAWKISLENTLAKHWIHLFAHWSQPIHAIRYRWYRWYSCAKWIKWEETGAILSSGCQWINQCLGQKPESLMHLLRASHLAVVVKRHRFGEHQNIC